ncbi:hypothetical protein [Streptomyces sp. H27-D2]|uniref:hypothetical protein n=1 Tax=Streptomyces sp. H27-D2 TaxID=3046304 RepID=UPI002DBA8C97|nr:hypothetical protein [Streptomyces sp. H27-D2]MEC4015301.1 hypothetical protein [Streptomyces sp. H27-D2]
MNLYAPTRTSTDHTDTATAAAAVTAADAPDATPAPAQDAAKPTSGPGSRPAARTQADGMAVASFILGLLGLLMFNIVLGPCALVLAGLALVRGTDRRGRACLGLALGAADLIILGVLVNIHGSVIWQFGG